MSLTYVEKLTHDEVADIGAKKLRSMGYPISFSNMTSATHGEQPDALGMNAYADSFLLEAKVSRSDFLSDKNKPWRKDGCGIGMRRAYITPKGLLNISDIPYGWELWEVHGKNKPVVKVIKGQVKKIIDHPHWSGKVASYSLENMDSEEFTFFKKQHTNFRNEASWALKVLRRAKEDGVNIEKYANGGFNK